MCEHAVIIAVLCKYEGVYVRVVYTCRNRLKLVLKIPKERGPRITTLSMQITHFLVDRQSHFIIEYGVISIDYLFRQR